MFLTCMQNPAAEKDAAQTQVRDSGHRDEDRRLHPLCHDRVDDRDREVAA